MNNKDRFALSIVCSIVFCAWVSIVRVPNDAFILILNMFAVILCYLAEYSNTMTMMFMLLPLCNGIGGVCELLLYAMIILAIRVYMSHKYLWSVVVIVIMCYFVYVVVGTQYINFIIVPAIILITMFDGIIEDCRDK